MRIDRLDLVRFGAVTDRSLDLSAGNYGLHVLHGSNETGKSTTLRAVRALLFGVPERTTDNFLHDGKDLRIGAKLRTDDGEAFEILRRKGRKNTLRHADDKATFDEAKLASLLGGVTESLYVDAFGLSHETLRQSGRELASGEGGLAQLLFGAGVGAARLRGLQDALNEELESLYKKQGSKPRINALLRELRDRAKDARAATLVDSAWRAAREEHDTALREAESADRQLAATEARRNRLARMLRTAPLLAERRQLQHALEAFDGLPEVRDDLGSEHARLQRALAECSEAVRSKRERREELRTKRDAVRLDDREQALLDSRATLDALRVRSSAAREAARELEGLELPNDTTDTPPIDPGTITPILESLRSTQQRGHELEDRLTTDRDVRDAKARELEAAKLAAGESGSPRSYDTDIQQLEDLLSAYGPLAKSAATLVEREAEWNEQSVRLDREIRALDGWSGDADSLHGAELPTHHDVQQFDRRFAQRDAQANDRDAERSRIEERIAGAELELDTLRRTGGVPSLDEFEAARTSRDRLWHRVRSRWLGPSETIEDDRSEDDAHVANAHERATEAADHLADSMRLGAEQVARRAQFEARLAHERTSLEKLTQDAASAASTNARLESEWQALWAALPLSSVGSPEVMARWLTDADRLRREGGESAAARAALDTLSAEALAAARALGELLGKLGEDVEAIAEQLPALLARGERCLHRLRTEHAEVQHAARQVEQASKELATAEQRLQKTEERRDQLDSAWRTLVESLDLAALEVRQPDSLEVAIRDLTRAESALRAAARARSVESFKSEVSDLRTRVAPDLETEDAFETFDLLSARVEPLADRRAETARLDGTLETLDDDIASLETRAATAQNELEGLLRPLEPHAQESEALDSLLLQLDRRRETRHALSDIEGKLLAAGDGLSLDALASELDVGDPDTVAAEARAADAELESQRTAANTARERATLAKQALAALDGNARAADLEANAEQIRATLAEEARRYRTLVTARTLLAREIEAYRREHQGPVLQRATELFRTLTLGEFTDLEVDYTDDGTNATLLATRATDDSVKRPALAGTRVPVSGLSAGTSDQLFLALKIATIETLIQGGRAPRLPVVLDDVLVHFDDARSHAALQVLAQLARTTQVLLFTHHESVAERARSVAGLFVHEMTA